LKEIGITHIVNAARGTKFSQIDTNQQYYDQINVKFYGITLMDIQTCKIENHLDDGIKFIDEALSNGKFNNIIVLSFFI
jgi:dual specificity phosphatase 3